MDKKVIVITPTIGTDYLQQCAQSIANQTYKNVEHLIVVDGPSYEKKVKKLLKKFDHTLFTLPYNTGKKNFYGHRIYSSVPHLVDCDYIIFLDEDNWFEFDHIKNAIDLIENLELDWCFSLRNILEQDGTFITKDNCESLGPWSPTRLIDTSAYCFKSLFIRRHCFIWDYGWGADRRFFSYLLKIKEKQSFTTTGKYTLNYRLGSSSDSVKKEFFIKQNDKSYKRFNGEFPWVKKIN